MCREVGTVSSDHSSTTMGNCAQTMSSNIGVIISHAGVGRRCYNLLKKFVIFQHTLNHKIFALITHSKMFNKDVIFNLLSFLPSNC